MLKSPAWRWLLIAASTLLAAGAGLVLWGSARSGRNPASPATEGPPAAPAPQQATPPIAGPSLSEVFRAVHGATGPLEVRVGDNLYRVSAEAAEPIGELLVLLTRADNVDECHACGGAMGIHYLRREPQGGFAVVGRWPDIVPGSSHGNASGGWAIRRDLASHPVLINEGGFTGQGITCSWANLVELAPGGPQLRGQVTLGYSNAGAIADGAAPTEYDGEIVRPVPDRGFEIAYRGTSSFTERYALSGGRYARVGASRLGDDC